MQDASDPGPVFRHFNAFKAQIEIGRFSRQFSRYELSVAPKRICDIDQCVGDVDLQLLCCRTFYASFRSDRGPPFCVGGGNHSILQRSY